MHSWVGRRTPMKNQNKINVKKYLKRVSSALNCKPALKSTFIRELKHNIEDTFSKDDVITDEMLCREFGTPEEIAAAFFDRKDYCRLLKKANRNFFICLIVCIILILALALSIAVIEDIYGMIGGRVVTIIE